MNFFFLVLLAFTAYGGVITQGASSLLGFAGFAIASIWDEEIRKDMERIHWNPFNSDESLILKSTKISFYNGVPVIKTNMGRSGTFGIIFLGSNATENDVKHEYGHVFQQLIMGPASYGFWVGIPSINKWGVSKNGDNYYYKPWESLASMIGGDSYEYSVEDKWAAAGHLLTSVFAGSFSYLFVLYKI